MQSSTKVRPSDILNDFNLDLDKVLNIAVKGTFKPVKKADLPKLFPNKQPKSSSEDIKKIMDKVDCPFFKQHKNKKHLNCEECEMNKKTQTENEKPQTELQTELQTEPQTDTVLSSPEPVVKKKTGRTKKKTDDNTKTTTKTTKRTRKTKKETK